jgi:hypothetical protein
MEPIALSSASLAMAQPAGVRLSASIDRQLFLDYLHDLQLDDCTNIAGDNGTLCFTLRDELRQQWTPQYDTTNLWHALQHNNAVNRRDLEREIVVAMLVAPFPFDYPSYQEFAVAVRIRANIVDAARRTQLNFHTEAVNRPSDCWIYSEESGFTILPGHSLITALQKATQPDASGRLYSFSCYRATEYVILLGIAQELALTNPDLLAQLQAQWETRAIMSGSFHDTFLYEYGSLDQPLPARYYVPGDRLWFRNPDERSSDIAGYEGSWVIYLGGGLFSNFWKPAKPYTLAEKCIEIFHWRDGAVPGDDGELCMDEARVEAHIQRSRSEPAESSLILQRMLRLRDPQGVYAEGGCLDASREYPRHVCPGTADISLPLA